MAYDPTLDLEDAKKRAQAEQYRIEESADLGDNSSAVRQGLSAAIDRDLTKKVNQGNRDDQGFALDGATYGGMAAAYDPVTGKMIRQSSAQMEADYYRQQAEKVAGRTGPNINYDQANEDRAGFQGQMGMSDASRAQQMGAYGLQSDATNRYAQMAAGQGPSLASALMSQGMNNIRAQQGSAAASARGPAAMAMAQQQAAGNMAAQGQQLNAQLGQMRNQEQMQAMQGYAQGAQGLSSAAGQMRAQDQSGAGMYNQARGISSTNAQSQAQMQQNQTAMNDAALAKSEANRMGVYDAEQKGRLQNRAIDNNVALANLESEKLHSAQNQALAGGLMSAGGAVVGSLIAPGPGTVAGAAAGKAAAGAAIPPPKSDERSKEKIASLSDALMRSQSAMYGAPSPIQETLRTAQPYAFNYKPGSGEDPSPRHVGVMAQDLERTPAGRTIVRDTAQGKVLDPKQAVGFNLAAAADLQKQIDALKAERMAQAQMAMYSAPVAVRGQ